MLGCKPINIPLDPNLKIGEQPTNNPVNKGKYQHLIKMLIYLSHTRPDMAFAISCVSQFMHSPLKEHMKVVYWVLKCLKGNLGRGLFFKKTEEKGVEAFIDTSWVGSVSDRRLTSGYYSFV